MMLNLDNHLNILARSVVRWNMSQVPQVKVTLKDLGDVVLLDKGMSASSLVNMLRQRRNQQHESLRPTSDPSSGTTYLKALELPILNQSHEGWVIKITKVAHGKMAFLVNVWPKTLFTSKTIFVLFPSATFAKEVTEPLRKIKINDFWENVLYWWLHGYIQPSSLFSAFDLYLLIQRPHYRGHWGLCYTIIKIMTK